MDGDYTSQNPSPCLQSSSVSAPESCIRWRKPRSLCKEHPGLQRRIGPVPQGQRLNGKRLPQDGAGGAAHLSRMASFARTRCSLTSEGGMFGTLVVGSRKSSRDTCGAHGE